MKRLLLLLALGALLLTGCSKAEEPAPPIQPVSFYYRTAEIDFAAEDGVIRAEVWDLGTATYSDMEILQLYLDGPRSEDYVSPMSRDTELLSVRRRGGTLEVQLLRNANSPAELDHSLTYACLAKTCLGLEGITKVRIWVSTRDGTLEDDVLLTDSDILLFDHGESPESQEVNLYYADEEGTFLLAERRSVPLLDPEALAERVLELLLSPPQSAGMRSPLPPGTAVLDVSLEAGVCTVDFNGDFYHNRPDTEQAEQLALLSVVNTLCELEGINQVQLYAEGQKLNPYVWLNLSEPWMLDSAPVGPVREELGEFAGVLCLPGQRDGLLHRLTVRSRAKGGASQEEALLLALYARSAQNGLAAPLSGFPLPLSVVTVNRVCTVKLDADGLPTEEPARTLALRAMVATLTALPAVDAVTITEAGEPVSDQPMRVEAEWFQVN